MRYLPGVMRWLPFAILTPVAALALGGCDCSAGMGPRDASGGDPDSGPADPRDAGPDVDGGPIDDCGNGLDDDGDDAIDEGCECEPGDTQRCFRGDRELAGVGGCNWGTQRCASDFEFGSWDVCVGDGEPTEEECDDVDNDCDGTVDEGCDCEIGATVECYEGPAITEGVGSCVRGRLTCRATAEGSAWSGCEGSVLPGEEICDGTGDEDCDERIDEGCSCLLGDSHDCYGGPPGTAGVGECRPGTQTCVMASDGTVSWDACTGEVRPGVESCTGGLDEDCDGLVDCDDTADCAVACCTPWSETLAVVPAEGEILFLVDRSGSMDWPAVGTTRTRWQELKTAMGSVLPMLDGLHMGLLTFPETTGGDERGNCMVSSSLDVPIGLGSRASILSRLDAADPRAGDTPTPQAFATAESSLGAGSSTRERFVILATDGLPEPACGSTVDATVDAITQLRAREGVDTFVLGIVGPDRDGDTSGIPALQAGLNRMADAGGRARPGAIRYYEAVDGAALTSALTAIVASATNCHFTVSGTPPRPGHLELRFDGALVPASRWSLTGSRLEVTGAACDQIQAGLVSAIELADDCSS